jgi:biopolymer transport protein ExbD
MIFLRIMRACAYLIFCCFLISSCKVKYSELSGHWLSKETGQSGFLTVDFEIENTPSWKTGQDTTYHKIVINKNSFTTDGGKKEYLFRQENYYEFYYEDDENRHVVKLEGDSLSISGRDFSGIFFRSNESETFYEELFNRSGVAVELPDASNLDTLAKSASWLNVHLNIGKNPHSIYQDSIFINYQEQYIKLNEIRILDFIPESESKNVMVFINADKSVPNQILMEVVKNFRRTDSTTQIFRSYFDYKTKRLFHRQLINED